MDALAETVTPVVAVMTADSAGATAENLSPDTKLVLEEITRCVICILRYSNSLTYLESPL